MLHREGGRSFSDLGYDSLTRLLLDVISDMLKDTQYSAVSTGPSVTVTTIQNWTEAAGNNDICL